MSWLMQVRRNNFIACEPHEDRTMTSLLAAILTVPNTVPGTAHKTPIQPSMSNSALLSPDSFLLVQQEINQLTTR